LKTNYSLYSNIIYTIIFLILLIYSAFREGIGTDYYTYEFYYTNSSFIVGDYGFKYLIILLNYISSNPRLFFIVSSVIIIVPTFFCIKNNSSNIFFSLILFISIYYFTSLNIVRQFMAVSLYCMLGPSFILDRKLLKHTLLVLILSTIHFTAIILLPIYFFIHKEFKSYTYYGLWLFSLLFIIDKKYFLLIWGKYLNNYLLEIEYNEKFTNYIGMMDSLQIEDKTYFRITVFNLIYIILLIFIKRTQNKNEQLILWFNFYFIAILFRNIFNNMMALQRMSLYFEFFIILLLPIFLSKKNSLVLNILLLGFFIIYAYYRFVIKHEAGIYF